MHCLTNMCYVCLEKKDKSLIDINSSLSVNEDIMHIIGYLPCSLGWLKTKQIILICDECCRRLRETYQFLMMCDKNSAVMQGYMNEMNISNTDNEAELRAHLSNKHDDINRIKCEIKSEDEEKYTVESVPIEESQEVFVNVDDFFVKDEVTWKREVVDDEEEPPMDNNCTGSSDNEIYSEIAVNSNAYDTDTDSDSSEAASTQVHTTNKKEPNTAAKEPHKCLTCSKTFSTNCKLQRHTRVHTGEKPFKCSTCKKCFADKTSLVIHMRTHTGEKPYECSRCKKCFSVQASLVIHMRTHTGEKPYECSRCKKCFTARPSLVCHIRTHTGEKPYECSTCKKCFSQRSHLVGHMRIHSG